MAGTGDIFGSIEKDIRRTMSAVCLTAGVTVEGMKWKFRATALLPFWNGELTKVTLRSA